MSRVLKWSDIQEGLTVELKEFIRTDIHEEEWCLNRGFPVCWQVDDWDIYPNRSDDDPRKNDPYRFKHETYWMDAEELQLMKSNEWTCIYVDNINKISVFQNENGVHRIRAFTMKLANQLFRKRKVDDE